MSKIVQLNRVTEVRPDEEGSLTFKITGIANKKQFSATISINPEERLWDVISGKLPENTDADVVGELCIHSVYKSAEKRFLKQT
jgi:hypothetical protein